MALESPLHIGGYTSDSDILQVLPQMAEELVITPYKAYSTSSQPHASYRTAKLQASSSHGAVMLWKPVPSRLISCVCGVTLRY